VLLVVKSTSRITEGKRNTRTITYFNLSLISIFRYKDIKSVKISAEEV